VDTTPSEAPATLSASLLARGIGARLLLAFLPCLLIWGGVWWALS